MIHQKTIQGYFEEELENLGRLTLLLYSDKQLLKEGRFEEFATNLLNRSKKSYYVTLTIGFILSLIGIFHIVGPADVWIGVAYIGGPLAVLNFATKEYYKIKGSMSMLLKLLETDEKEELSPSIKLVNM